LCSGNSDPEDTIFEACAHVGSIDTFREPECALERSVDTFLTFLLLRLLLWLLDWCFRLWLGYHGSLGGGRLFYRLLLALGFARFSGS
jgi:hypothetical protein